MAATKTARFARKLKKLIERECKRNNGRLVFPDTATGEAICDLLKSLRHVNIYASGHEILVKPAAHIC